MLCRVTTRGLAMYVYGFADRDEVLARVTRFAAAVHDAAVVRRNRTHAGLALKMGLPASVVCPVPGGVWVDRAVCCALSLSRTCAHAQRHTRLLACALISALLRHVQRPDSRMHPRRWRQYMLIRTWPPATERQTGRERVWRRMAAMARESMMLVRSVSITSALSARRAGRRARVATPWLR